MQWNQRLSHVKKINETEDAALLDLRSARGGAVTAEQNDKFWRPE